MTETDWDQYFHPKLSGNDKPEFDWEGWVEEHVAPQAPATSKDWKGDKWVPNDYKLAGKVAKDMHDMLAGDDENRTEDSSTHGLGCPPEIAKGLSLLTLYDLVMLLDDSTSMTFKEKEDPSDVNNTTARARKDTLLRVLEDVCTTYQCCRKGIISVKFFNARTGWGNVDKDKFDKKKFTYKCQGVTRIGSELKRKIVDQYVFKSGFVMPKPLLVIVITDGKVEGESEGLLEHVVINCVKECRDDSAKGSHAVSFQFAQVGRDKDAARFLRNLAKDATVKDYVDCVLNTSLDYIWRDDMKWGIIAQLLLGAITDQWSNKSAPVQWKDQPKQALPTRSTAKDDQSDPFVEEDIPDDD